jgi:hypothetical protein
MAEPIHDFLARTTETSKSEGRLKVGVSLKKRKRRRLKSIIKKYKESNYHEKGSE